MNKFTIFLLLFLLCLNSVNASTITRYGSDFEIVNNEINFKVTDRLGSDRLTLDDENVVTESNVLPYGQQLKNNNIKFSFTGKELDNTNNYYFNARYYDYDSGKFLGVDPVRDNHAYSYVSNNPMNYVDSDGNNPDERVGNTAESFMVAMTSSAIWTGTNSYFEGNGFWKGFAAGLLGGAIEAGSKEFFIHNQNQFYPTKLMHSAGTSIKGNAIKGDNWFSSYRTLIGPAYVEVGSEGLKLTPSPLTLLVTTGRIILGQKFSFKDSVKTGSLIFHDSSWGGDSSGNSIVVSTNGYKDKNSILRHEWIHTLQFEERTTLFTQSVQPRLSKWTKEDYKEQEVSVFTGVLIKTITNFIAEAAPFHIEYKLSGDFDFGENYLEKNVFEAEARRFE